MFLGFFFFFFFLVRNDAIPWLLLFHVLVLLPFLLTTFPFHSFHSFPLAYRNILQLKPWKIIHVGYSYVYSVSYTIFLLTLNLHPHLFETALGQSWLYTVPAVWYSYAIQVVGTLLLPQTQEMIQQYTFLEHWWAGRIFSSDKFR